MLQLLRLFSILRNKRFNFFFYFQIPLFVLGFALRIFEEPGNANIALFSWFASAIYFSALSIIYLVRKNIYLFLLELTLALATTFIYTKPTFEYYNVFLHVLVIAGLAVFLVGRETSKSEVKKLKIKPVLITLLLLNGFLLFISDNSLTKFFYHKALFYSEKNFSWDCFERRNVNDQRYDEHDAYIMTGFYEKTNKCYNYKPALLYAVSVKEMNYRYIQTPALLRHELYHFKITELMAKMANYEFDQHFCLNEHETENIIIKYKNMTIKLQELYDIETNHNRNKENQKIWENRIDYLFNVFDR